MINILLVALLNSLITITSINNISFTNQYDSSKETIIPAAYTSSFGEIKGLYRIDGITYGTPFVKELVSIHPTKGIIIGTKWYSDNGFQQHILVKNSKFRKFKDPKKRIRRALCNKHNDPSSLFIVESKIPMTMSEFAEYIQPYCWNAVNLDTGTWGYCKIQNKIRFWWMIFNKHKQTNWIVC